MKSLLLMIVFITRIPIKYPYEYKDEDFIKGVKLIPVIGLIVGLAIFIPTLFRDYLDKPIIIILVWFTYIWITGGLHIDGLTDTFDGIFSNRDKERILEIMKDSRIGTFGVIGLLFILLSNITLSYYIDYKILILVPVVGRTSSIIACSLSKYARSEMGMGTIIVENCKKKEVIFAVTFTLLVFIILKLKLLMIIPILFTQILVVLLTKYIKGKIGGMTGDTIGFTIEVSQTIYLFFTYFISKVL